MEKFMISPVDHKNGGKMEESFSYPTFQTESWPCLQHLFQCPVHTHATTLDATPEVFNFLLVTEDHAAIEVDIFITSEVLPT